jgi:predicted GH43/DUF377 family glycosyl hydrolase
MVSHAALPVPVRIGGDRYRVYCAGRDAEGRGQVGYVEFALRNPHGTLTVSPKPVLHFGELGTFDDRGVLPACIVADGASIRLFYTGVMLGQTVPFYFNVGSSTSGDGGVTFEKCSRAPLLERTDADPILTASPCVLRENGRWRMWYVSGVRWAIEDGAPKHYYHVRYAESDDGARWRRDGTVCIDFRPGEYAISRPCVVKIGERYCMWYSYRGNAYRIGYAESADGVRWQRIDESVSFDSPFEGWDERMQCYPWVFPHDDEWYMLYNGNDYGRTGFGLAKLMA